MPRVVVKAFVVCEEIHHPLSPPMDLIGAGFAQITAPGPFPFRKTFWVYLELLSDRRKGKILLSLRRADSERPYEFREIAVEHPSPRRATIKAVRLFNIEFPAKGSYFVELWYNDRLMADHQIEIV
jgi:hypothetical protein